MGKRRQRGRPVDGVLLLDKPKGMTSNAALQTVKRLLDARKGGHTGSLDPLATGLLPLCFGEATKISAYLLNADKRYLTEIKLGERTTTGDAEGEVVETRPVPSLDAATVESVLARFCGEIEQIPPMHSAIKYKGEPLYKLAHQGKEVAREPRRVTIHALELVSLEGDRLVLDIRCSKGTYVRTLAEDIGEALGCGGHVSELRRTEVGALTVDDAVTLETLQQAREEGGPQALEQYLLPMGEALRDWPGVQLKGDAAYYLRMGQPVLVPRAPTEGWVRLYEEDRFLGVGEIIDDGRVAPRRLVKVA